MQPTTLYIDHVVGETRIALCDETDALLNLTLLRTGTAHTTRPKVGDIYYGRIHKTVAKLKACFVDLGHGPHGFLPLSALPQPHNGLEGRAVLVQIKQEAVETKGPALTTRLELKSQATVLTPLKAGFTVSRKIQDPEKRAALEALLAPFQDTTLGGIIRTHAETLPIDAVSDDLHSLIAQWRDIEAQFAQRKKPHCLFTQETPLSDLAARYPDLNVQACAPDLLPQLRAHWETVQAHTGTLFQDHDLEAEIEALTDSIVPFGQGASLIIEPTAAFVAVDVNAGPHPINQDSARLRPLRTQPRAAYCPALQPAYPS